MKINNVLKQFSVISKEYTFFALLITASIALTYGVFVITSYKNHKETYNQQYLSQAFSVANSYEVFLDNIFRQAEFIGHKIENKHNTKQINSLLNRNFSLNVNLDTSLISSWLKFNWKPAHNNINHPDFIASAHEPWMIKFNTLHSIGHDQNTHYIPIHFGVTNHKDQFIGNLTSQITIGSLLHFLQRNIKNKDLDLVILDQDYNIIANGSKQDIKLPKAFFKNERFHDNAGNIYKEYHLNNTSYIAYKKLESYPFIVVIGGNKDVIFKPLFHTLTKYFIILGLALCAILLLLLIFYKRIITPITTLSTFAKDIISSPAPKPYHAKNHAFVEINNLEQALIHIKDYKENLKQSNDDLHEKTTQLSDIKQKLEDDLQQLAKSYELRDELMKQSLKNNKNLVTKDVIEQCLTMLYPEIYSRQITINKILKDLPKLNMQYCHFVKIATSFLSRSFMFSAKNSCVTLRTESTIIHNIHYFCLTIEDEGIGDEQWRDTKLKEHCDTIAAKQIIDDHQGIFHFIDNDDAGVKYCILLPYEKKESSHHHNVIHFPVKKK